MLNPHPLFLVGWFLIMNPDTFMEVSLPVATEKACYAKAQKMHLRPDWEGVPGYVCQRADRIHRDPYDPF